MSVDVTSAELADVLDEVRAAILLGLVATVQGITPGIDASESRKRLEEALGKLDDRANRLRAAAQ